MLPFKRFPAGVRRTTALSVVRSPSWFVTIPLRPLTHKPCCCILSVSAESIINFSWEIPKSGFEWGERCMRGVKQPTLFLVERDTPAEDVEFPGGDGPLTYYNPLTITGLFRSFADIEPTRESILQFANRYGFLGGRARFSVRSLESRKKRRGYCNGEAFETWVVEILTMRHALEFWQRARARDMKWLSQFIQWSEVPTLGATLATYVGPKIPPAASQTPLQLEFSIGLKADLSLPANPIDRYVFASWAPSALRHGPPRPVFFPLGDELAPAWTALQGIINTKLTHYPANANVGWSESARDRVLRLKLIPTSLISALWLQFATGVEGDRKYRRCETCHVWFEVGTHAREGAKFCRNACRFKAYRMRQVTARRLHSRGMAIGEIAQRVNSDVETVKGWIKK